MKCLLVHDLQNDFFSAGPLPAIKSVDFVDRVNQLLRLSGKKFDCVVATQDYHKPQHHAFASNNPGKKADDKIELHHDRQILWLDHCLQNTPGSSFHPGLDIYYFSYVVKKGMNPMFDTGSGFFDKGKGEKTLLDEYLKFKGIKEVYILGNALDLGITQTAIDGLELGYKMTLIKDLCPIFKLPPDKVEFRWDDLKEKGVRIINSDVLSVS